MFRSFSRLPALGVLLSLLSLGACTPAPDQVRTEAGVRVGVRTEPRPPELGENRFFLTVRQDERGVEQAQVALRMYMPGMPMSTDDTWIETTDEGGGAYTGQGEFSMGGNWQVEVAVRIAGRDPVTVVFPYTIKWELK